jgi:hypothetical protein
VVDCIAAAVRQAELLVHLKLPKPSTGSYALPPAREMVGVHPSIAARLAPAGPR